MNRAAINVVYSVSRDRIRHTLDIPKSGVAGSSLMLSKILGKGMVMPIVLEAFSTSTNLI